MVNIEQMPARQEGRAAKGQRPPAAEMCSPEPQSLAELMPAVLARYLVQPDTKIAPPRVRSWLESGMAEADLVGG